MIALVAWIMMLELATSLSPFRRSSAMLRGPQIMLSTRPITVMPLRLDRCPRFHRDDLESQPAPLSAFSGRRTGITVYLLLVSAWFWLQLPAPILAPLFFADPAGAVVGKTLSRKFGPRWNPPWCGPKTVAGSCAVFALTYLTIAYECTVIQRAGLAAAATVAEAVGGDYDNLAIAAVVLVGWWCV